MQMVWIISCNNPGQAAAGRWDSSNRAAGGAHGCGDGSELGGSEQDTPHSPPLGHRQQHPGMRCIGLCCQVRVRVRVGVGVGVGVLLIVPQG